MKSNSVLSHLRCRAQITPRGFRYDTFFFKHARGRRLAHIPAEDPHFLSIVDNPPKLVKVGSRHGPGLIILGMYISSFSSSKNR